MPYAQIPALSAVTQQDLDEAVRQLLHQAVLRAASDLDLMTSNLKHIVVRRPEDPDVSSMMTYIVKRARDVVAPSPVGTERDTFDDGTTMTAAEEEVAIEDAAPERV